ncbi:MAG: hypothetical protein LBR82_06720 [Desulfovibrio sp.]|nr:hypothetical protein [Desulfovibrio sp.]
MAVNALTLAACLRPWRGAGIYALLRDDEEYGLSGVAFDDAAAGQADRDSRGFRSSKMVADGAEYEAARPYRDVARPAYGKARGAGADDVAGPVAEDAGWNDAGPASGSRERAVQSSPSLSATGSEPSAAQFSPLWRALLEKTRPAPLVWTYEELGSDLQGNASAERSRCLKALIAALALPRGSSSFWPLSLPASAAGSGTKSSSVGGAGEERGAAAEGAVVSENAGSNRACPPVRPSGSGADASENAGICAEFAAGVRLLGAGVVLYFGTASALRSGFALTIRAPYTQQIAGGLQHILLPALSALAEGPERTEKAVAYLRSVLTAHPLLRARAAKGQA